MDEARYRCRMNVVESALERVSIRVYNHKMFRNRNGWKFLSGQKFRCVWSEKLEILLFQNVEFCFHETCLGLDLRRYACAMDMVDSAFERIDVGLFKSGIDYNVRSTFVALQQKLIWWNWSLLWRRSEKKSCVMLVGLNPISTLGLNLRNGLSEQNSEVTIGKEIIFYVDPPGEEFTKNYSSSSYQAAKISSHSGSTRGRPRVDARIACVKFSLKAICTWFGQVLKADVYMGRWQI